MSIICPNKSHPDFKKLISEVGEFEANRLYFANGGEIPSISQKKPELLHALSMDDLDAFLEKNSGIGSVLNTSNKQNAKKMQSQMNNVRVVKTKYFKERNEMPAFELLNLMRLDNKNYTAIFDHIAPLIKLTGTSIEYRATEGEVSFNLYNEAVSAGYFDMGSNKIVVFNSIRENDDDTSLILHEMLHAVSADILKTNSIASKEMQMLFEYAKENLPHEYALTNVDEFLVALFTNKPFCEKLSGLPPLKGRRKFKNLLEEVLDIFLRAMGFSKQNETLYTQAFAAATHVFEEFRALKEGREVKESTEEAPGVLKKELSNTTNPEARKAIQELVAKLQDFDDTKTYKNKTSPEDAQYEKDIRELYEKYKNVIVKTSSENTKNETPNVNNNQDASSKMAIRLAEVVAGFRNPDGQSKKMTLEDAEKIARTFDAKNGKHITQIERVQSPNGQDGQWVVITLINNPNSKDTTGVVKKTSTETTTTQPVNNSAPGMVPESPRIKELFGNRTTMKASELLQKLIDTGSQDSELARYLLTMIHKTDVDIVYSNTLGPSFPLSNGGTGYSAAFHNPVTNTITIYNGASTFANIDGEIILHEIIHALSFRMIRTDSKGSRQLNELFDAVRQMLPYEYALNDIDEFMVGIFTNPAFIARLKKLPPIDSRHRNLFEQIWDSLLSLMGFKKGTTLYDQALAAGTTVLNDFKAGKADNTFVDTSGGSNAINNNANIESVERSESFRNPDGSRKRLTHDAAFNRAREYNSKNKEYKATIITVMGEKGDTRVYEAIKLVPRNQSSIADSTTTVFHNASLQPLTNIIDKVKSDVKVINVPVKSLFLGGNLNEKEIMARPVFISELTPLFVSKIKTVSSANSVLNSLVGEDISSENINEKAKESEELQDFLVGETVKILNSIGHNVDENSTLETVIGKYSDDYQILNSMDGEPSLNSKSMGSLNYDDQSPAQKIISDKLYETSQLIGDPIEVKVEDIVASGRTKKEKTYLKTVFKGEETAMVYSRKIVKDGEIEYIRKRTSHISKEKANRFKTVEEIQKEEMLRVYSNTGTAFHESMENLISKVYAGLDVNSILEKLFPNGKKFYTPADIESAFVLAKEMMSNDPALAKAYEDEKKRLLGLKILTNKEGRLTKDMTNFYQISSLSKDTATMFDNMAESMLRDFIDYYSIQHEKNVAAKKKNPIAVSLKPNIIVERKIYDGVKDEAGTMDLLFIYSDGEGALLDHKFMTAKFGTDFKFSVEESVGNYNKNKEEGYAMQQARYSEVLTKLYGVKKLVRIRIKPTFLKYTRDLKGKVTEKSQVIDVWTSDIMGLFSTPEERTGNIPLDKFLNDINKQIENIKQDLTQRSAWQVDFIAVQKLTNLKNLVRSIQIKGDLSSYLTYVKTFIDSTVLELNSTPIEDINIQRINTLTSELDFVTGFMDNISGILDTYKDAYPEAYASFNLQLGTVFSNLDQVKNVLKENRVEKLRELSARQGMDNDIFNSYKTSGDISGVQKYLLGMKTINHPLVQVFSKEVDRLHAERISIQNRLIKDLEAKTKPLDAWAAARGLTGVKKFGIMLNAQKNLIQEFTPEYWEFKNNFSDYTIPGAIAWVEANLELVKGSDEELRYLTAKENYIKATTAYVEDSNFSPENKVILLKKKIEDWSIKNRVKYMSPKDPSKWYSNEYKELLKTENKPAKDYYDFLIAMNIKFREMVGNDFDISKNFVPHIHKTLVDTIAQDGLNTMGIFRNYMAGIKNSFMNTNDTNDKTASGGDKNIPIMFMGFIEVEEKSIDLGKNLMLFATFINQYRNAKKLADVGDVIKRVILDTPMAITKKGSKVKDAVNADQFMSESAAESNLLKAVNDYYNYYVYGESTKQDAITDVLGDKGVKAIGLIQNISGRSNMSFNFMAAFAGTINTRLQTLHLAAAGKYFTAKQIAAATAAVVKFNPKLAYLSYEYEVATNHTSDIKVAGTSTNKLVRHLGEDPVYVFERWFSDGDKKVVLHAVLNNFGIDPVSGVIYQLDRLEKKYKNHPVYGTTVFKSLWDSTIEIPSTEAKGKSDFKLVNQHTGEEVSLSAFEKVTNEELENTNLNTITSMRTKTNELLYRIKGEMTAENVAGYRLGLLGRALGKYRNWIPGTFNERLKKENYNLVLEEYEIGRWRASWRLLRASYLKVGKGVLMGLIPFRKKGFDDIDPEVLRVHYDEFIANNPELKDKVSIEEYADEYKGKMRSMMIEIKMFAAVLALAALTKGLIDDDDEKDNIAAQFLIASLNRVNMEVGFYLPVPGTPGAHEFMKLVTKDPLPLMAELKNSIGLVTNTFAETLDFAYGVEAGKTISPRIEGTDFQLNFDEKQDGQGKAHYFTNYLGLKHPATWLGLRDTNKREDTIWDYFDGEKGG